MIKSCVKWDMSAVAVLLDKDGSKDTDCKVCHYGHDHIIASS